MYLNLPSGVIGTDFRQYYTYMRECELNTKKSACIRSGID